MTLPSSVTAVTASTNDYGDACLMDDDIDLEDIDWNIPQTTVVARARNNKKKRPCSSSSSSTSSSSTTKVQRPKRKYDTEKARRTRAERKAMRAAGIDPGSHYKPRNGGVKRSWVASGKYVGATIKKGGRLRQFRDMRKYRQVASKFVATSVLEDGNNAAPPPLLASQMPPRSKPQTPPPRRAVPI